MISIYIHGFNSVFDPNGYKIAVLIKIGKVTGATYDSFMKNHDFSSDANHVVIFCHDPHRMHFGSSIYK